MGKHSGAQWEGIQVASRGKNTVDETGSAFLSRGSLAAATSVIICAVNGSFHTITAELRGPY